MYAVSGYIDGNTVVANESIKNYEGYNVIIPILDSISDNNASLSSPKTDISRKQAVRSLAGLWKSHNNEQSVDDMVRTMRRGRSFDS